MLHSRPSWAITRGVAPRFAWLLLLVVVGTPLTAQEPPPTETRQPPPARAQSSPPPPAKPKDGMTFQVVINGANPTTEMTASKVAKMFLKKDKRWDHGVRALPVDLEARHPVRKAFTKSVHRKTVTAIQSLWQRYIFSGRDVPPDQKASEQEVLAFVRSNPGAIGYVAAETSLGAGVKKLEIAQ